jgi:hypothetical protein
MSCCASQVGQTASYSYIVTRHLVLWPSVTSSQTDAIGANLSVLWFSTSGFANNTPVMPPPPPASPFIPSTCLQVVGRHQRAVPGRQAVHLQRRWGGVGWGGIGKMQLPGFLAMSCCSWIELGFLAMVCCSTLHGDAHQGPIDRRAGLRAAWCNAESVCLLVLGDDVQHGGLLGSIHEGAGCLRLSSAGLSASFARCLSVCPPALPIACLPGTNLGLSITSATAAPLQARALPDSHMHAAATRPGRWSRDGARPRVTSERDALVDGQGARQSFATRTRLPGAQSSNP